VRTGGAAGFTAISALGRDGTQGAQGLVMHPTMARRSILALALALPCFTGCLAEDASSEQGEQEVGTAADALSVTQWSADRAVPSSATLDAPAIAGFGGTAHLVHTGYDSNRLYHQIFDGTTWSAPQEIPGQYSKNRPALATMGTKGNYQLHMVHQGDTLDDLWWSVYDGVSWTKNDHLALKSHTAPVMTAYNGKLYLFGTVNTLAGETLLPSVYQAVYDGVWGPMQVIQQSVDGAAVTTHNGQLVLVTTSDHYLYMSTSTGNGWTQPRQIVGQKSKSAPALASYGGYLHMTHLGDTSNSIWWSTWDGASWATNVSLPGQTSRWAPSLASAGGKLFQAHIGGTSDSLFYSTFQ